MRIAHWLAPWVPPESALVLNSVASAFTQAIEALLGWAPTLAGGLSVIVWVTLSIGSVFLIGQGFLVA